MSIRYSLLDSGFTSSSDAEFFVPLQKPMPEEVSMEFDTEEEFWDWFSSSSGDYNNNNNYNSINNDD